MTSYIILKRGISTTCNRYGKRNFNKFLFYNKRGSLQFKEEQRTNKDCDIPIDKRGVRDIGYYVGDQFKIIPEMIPELIVPNLEGFELKPYVSYQVDDIEVSEFTAYDLFHNIYADKIKEDFEKGELDCNDNPLKPSENEKLTPEEAKILARKTGSDIFLQKSVSPLHE
ncbi:large ribosomal subunit protein mL41 [Prorops nasuta]|uniref:large ribosomal subunit protein mL41 n=1 Tax=Prorops nasuta TaxID=863751 RepID=UPI0034CDBF92